MSFVHSFLPPATKLGQGYVTTGVCDSVHRGVVHGCWGVHGCHREEQGAYMVARGHACLLGGAWLKGGHAWLLGGAWLPGGMHGCWGACMVAGGVCGCWGACMVARGHAWLLGEACVVARGTCVVDGGHVWLLGGMHGCQGWCVVAGGMHGCWGHA